MAVEEGGKKRKNNATVCIFQNECSLDSRQETRNEHKLSPNSGGHYLKRMSNHYKHKCNIEGQCLRKKLNPLVYGQIADRWESHTNIILRYHSKLTKIPGDCHNNKHTLRKHIIKFSQCIHILFPQSYFPIIFTIIRQGEGLTSDVPYYCKHQFLNSDIILSTRNIHCYYLHLLGLITY